MQLTGSSVSSVSQSSPSLAPEADLWSPLSDLNGTKKEKRHRGACLVGGARTKGDRKQLEEVEKADEPLQAVSDLRDAKEVLIRNEAMMSSTVFLPPSSLRAG